MLTLSKDKSTLIKGIVIIMMVFLHLFNGNHTDLCTNLLYIGDEPFAKWLSKACGPVDFFLLLSGYGLAYTYDHRGISFAQQVKRIFKLYIHYWIVLLIFVSVGCFMYAERYPGDWNTLILNVIGWETSYNGEMWFLFPYGFICLLSPWLFYVMRRIGYIKALMITALIHVLTCYLISRYGTTFLYGNQLVYMPILILHLLYAFTVGTVFYQYRNRFKSCISSRVAIVSVCFVVALVAFIDSAVVYMLYVPLMVFLFCQISYPKWMEIALLELGRKSMPIWMIHTWFCYYLFQSQIYSLKYSVLILGGVILISYLTAIPVMWSARKLFCIIKLDNEKT